MVIESKAESIGVIVISLIIGLVMFYLFSDLPKKERKKYIESLISQLINFIIFIWVGKILLNLPLFIQDPLAVLAYPGDSGAFYLAVLFTASLVFYKSLRKQLDLFIFAESFVQVFLISLFFYEFFRLNLEDNTYSLGSLVLLGVLLSAYFLLRHRVTTFKLLISVLIAWTLGLLVLNSIYPFVTVFGYLIEVWFIIAFFIGCFSLLFSHQILHERKKK